MRFISALLFLLLSACTSAQKLTSLPMKQYDADTKYAIEPNETGFVTYIEYSRYQFASEGDALAVACKSAVMNVAFHHAEQIKRKIDPINEQRIRISLGRNGASGVSTCSASAPASFYVEPQRVGE